MTHETPFRRIAASLLNPWLQRIVNDSYRLTQAIQRIAELERTVWKLREIVEKLKPNDSRMRLDNLIDLLTDWKKKHGGKNPDVAGMLFRPLPNGRYDAKDMLGEGVLSSIDTDDEGRVVLQFECEKDLP